MTFAMYGALAGFFFSLVVFLQQTRRLHEYRGRTRLNPGYTLTPRIFGSHGNVHGKNTDQRLFMTLGPIVSGLGILSLIQVTHSANYLLNVLPGIVLFGIGLTLFVTPLTATVMSSVGHQDSGIASGINNAVSRAAGLIVVALLGLFGASNAYVFAVFLCAGLSFFAGVSSFFFIRNKTSLKTI